MATNPYEVLALGRNCDEQEIRHRLEELLSHADQEQAELYRTAAEALLDSDRRRLFDYLLGEPSMESRDLEEFRAHWLENPLAGEESRKSIQPPALHLDDINLAELLSLDHEPVIDSHEVLREALNLLEEPGKLPAPSWEEIF
ncbi:hypothetical protein JW905_00345 [bacterium]|nr:hypothetical protein [candidate division CSSED10-310 bacterium]